uniref:NADH dehydrogenase subunit 1 n=1 Tax=Elodes marginata TaxID=446436 RepID=UPI0020295DBA|nr:NADH dehydrogenase subunit 1 [Elodes marginata]UPL65135.1 NADH dehydrogenase subunit 1 [Elodes marginata]
MYFVELILVILMSIIMIVCVLISVAFLTLMERKVLGYIQIRKGPNKLGFMGILQPFSDAIKLFSKEQTFPIISNYLIYFLCPIINLFLSLFLWLVLPFLTGLYYFNLGMLFLLCCMSMGVYTIMVAGWSSNSNYSLLGGLRAVAQTISYEVSMALVLMSFMLLVGSYSFFDFYLYQKYVYMMFLTFFLMLVWMVIMLAETNRTPFDFAEGESELVSGFNVEYSSGGFALLFLAEYSSILFMSGLFSIIFLSSNLISLFFFLKLTFISFFFIWVRGTLPRYRYDKLMYLAWKIFLSLSLNYLIFYLGLKMFYFSLLV